MDKTRLCRILAVFLFLFAFAAPGRAAPIVIKLSHVVAEDTPKGRMALKLKELAEARLPGRVEVQVYPDAKLCDDDKVLAALLLSEVQLAAPALSKFEGYTRKLRLFDLPFLFPDMRAVDAFQQSPKGRELLHAMDGKGILGLEYLHNGMKQLSAKKPLRLPADAAGLKFRVMPSDVLAAQFEALHATPLKKNFSEVYALLEEGAIDGQENTWSNIYSQRFFEVQADITESNHGLLDSMVVTSVEFWSSLPEDIRIALAGCVAQAVAYGNRVSAEKEVADREKVVASGRCRVIGLTPEERRQWVEAMKPVWRQFESEIGPELIRAAEAAK